MTKKGIQESNFIFNKDCTRKFIAHKTRLPIIKCVCGFEILLVPDLKAMDRAIKNHVTDHKKASDVSKRLTEQVLIAAAN
jgi:hypothetical protein